MTELDAIRSLLIAANEDRRSGRSEAARPRIAEALERARRVGDPGLLAWVMNDLARVERDLGHIEASVELYRQLARRREESGDLSGVAHAVRHLGDIRREAGSLEEAAEHYRRADELYRSLGMTGSLDFGNAARGYALLAGQLGQGDDALRLWGEARAVYAQLGITEGVEEADGWIRQLVGGN